MADVHVFGDSHWRVFFPILNDGEPGYTYEQDGVRTIDMVGNTMSGATMYGLSNPNSKTQARQRIIDTIDGLDGIDNVGLTFGEVDVRYHNGRYYRPDGSVDIPRIFELLAGFKRFIDESLLLPRRVRGTVFVYYGYRYNPFIPVKPPKDVSEASVMVNDPVPNDAMLEEAKRMLLLHRTIEQLLPSVLAICEVGRTVWITPREVLGEAVGSKRYVSDDGVHLRPGPIYTDWVLPALRSVLCPRPRPARELPL